MKFNNKLLILSLLGVFVFISTILVSLLFYFNVFDNTPTNDLVVSLYQYASIEEAFKDNNWFGMYLTIGIGSAILFLIILIIIFACAYKTKKKKIEKNKRTSATTLNANNLTSISHSNMKLPSNDESNFFTNYSQQNNQVPLQRSVATRTTTASTRRPAPPSERTTTTTTKKTVKKSTSTTCNNRK